MTVKEILSHKGVDVVTTDPHASIADAVELLATRRIGAVVVTGADRRIVGILSERDIVRALADKGSGALDTPVAEVMTRKVDTCSLNQTVSELMEQMTAGKFRHVPVVEQGRLAGIISIGDVVKSRRPDVRRVGQAHAGRVYPTGAFNDADLGQARDRCAATHHRFPGYIKAAGFAALDPP